MRTYTVNPAELLHHIQGVPSEIIPFFAEVEVPCCIDSCLLELPEASVIGKVNASWKRLEEQGWVKKSAPAEWARWIQANAIVQREYTAREVTNALCDLQLLAIEDFGESLDSVRCLEMLPLPDLYVPEKPWSSLRPIHHNVVRTVALPAGCAGAFFGKGGANLTLLLSQLRSVLAETDVLNPPEVNLAVSMCQGTRKCPGCVDIKVKWERWERSGAALPAANKVDAKVNEIKEVVTQNIYSIYHARMQKSVAWRRRRAERAWAYGTAFHAMRRAERNEKRQCPTASAKRGLELPPTGISRKFAPARPNRKDMLQQRRRAMLREKRERLLRACDELSLSQAQHMCSKPTAHVDALRAASGNSFNFKPCGTGAARRLLKQLHTCQGEVAEKALESLSCARASVTKRRPQEKPRKQNRQHSKLMAIRLDV